MSRIDTVRARAALGPRREPYWLRLSPGCYLGFRRMTADSAGTWLARAVDTTTGKRPTHALGEFADLPDSRRYAAAKAAAEAWFEHLDKGGSAAKTTIRDVCERYIAHLRATKPRTTLSPYAQARRKGTPVAETVRAAEDAAARFKNYVLDDPRFAATDASKLTPAMLDQWRARLQQRPTASGSRRGATRTASTLNRDMSCLRAALNLAFLDGLVTSDFAWRSKLRPIKDADRRRETYLDKEQRRRFIGNADPDLALFLRGLALLPLRPGALAALTVADFNRRLGVLKVGHDKAGRDRKIKLPKATAELFDEATKDRPATAPIFARADGRAWDKDGWKWPVKAAARAAKLADGTTAYTLRHSTITDLVHDGLDLLTVAQISGTSVKMIEQHYGHLRGDVAAVALARLAL